MWRALKPLGLFSVFLLFFSVSPNDADLVYRAEGEDVILRPPPMTGAVQHVEWKHNNNNNINKSNNTAAQWNGNELQCLGQFEGRCEVNNDTGALTIKGLNVGDSGVYTPEIMGEDLSRIELSVISRVAKPSVDMSCNLAMTYCNLTCEGNTTDAEPVTYKWFVDDEEEEEGPSGQQFLLTEFFVEHSYRCLMMNPVSNETSESITNPTFICGRPFIEEVRDLPVSILVPVAVVGLIFLIIVILFAVFISRHIRERRQRAQYDTLEKDTDWEKDIEKV